MQEDRNSFAGMHDAQISAISAQERRDATDKIPIEELVTTVRQTAYALHLYLGTGYLEKVYENGLKHRLEKKGIFVESQVPLAVVDEIENPTASWPDPPVVSLSFQTIQTHCRRQPKTSLRPPCARFEA